MSSAESSPASVPDIRSETSRGSSVSGDLQREYEDLLKYAIVTPRLEVGPSVYSERDAPASGLGLFSQQQSQFNMTQQQQGPAKREVDFGNRKSKNANLSTIAEVSSTNTSISSSDFKSDGSEDDEAKKARQKKTTASLSISAYQEAHQGFDLAKQRQQEEKNSQISAGSAALQKLLGTGESPYHLFNKSQNSESSSNSTATTPTLRMFDEFEEIVDGDIIRMEGLMDEWCLDMKRNFLGEFSNSKLRLLEKMKQKMHLLKQKNALEVDALQDQIGNLKELLHTFEKSIHQKDIVITNLTDAVQKQKEKHEKLKVLLTWKLKHNDEKRELFAAKLAQKHYKRNLLSKTWLGWRSVIEMRWKQRVERACQARSQEVCIKLTEDYEERLQGLQKSLEVARLEVAKLHNERDQYEETMKKAFMRGVCALNMEAMTMFKEGGNEENFDPSQRDLEKGAGKGMTSQQPASSQPGTSGSGPSGFQAREAQPTRKPILQAPKNKSEGTIHVKAVGKSSFAGKKPPSVGSGQAKITSVFVERHRDQNDAGLLPYQPTSLKANEDGTLKSRVLSGTQKNAGKRQTRCQTVKVVD